MGDDCAALVELRAELGANWGDDPTDWRFTEWVTSASGKPRCVGFALPGQGFGPRGVVPLAKCLGKLTSLRNVVLYENAFGDEGAKVLAPSLEKLTSLERLNLCCNQFGAEGARALAPALPSLTKLTELKLGGNQLDDEAARVLAPVLGSLPSLKECSLRMNDDISAEQREALCKAAPKVQLHFTF